ncbi:MAG: extracellular solute-binding protein, partial [Anaerolineales bacterium]
MTVKFLDSQGEKNEKDFLAILALLVVTSLLLAACGGGAPTTEAPAADAPAPTEAATDAPAPAGVEALPQGQELANAYAGEYSGTVVTMSGPFTDADAVKFDQSIKAFEEATGIDIQYSGSKEFEASIRVAVEGGTVTDIVDFPQPGLLASFVAQGKVIDVNSVINPDWLAENYIDSWLQMGTMEGPDGPIMAGIWARANGKSFVFYPKAA